jgi:hypothetical protein
MSALGTIATEDLLVLEVDAIDYTFAPSSAPQTRTLYANDDVIREVIRREKAGNWVLPEAAADVPEEIRRLEEAGIVISVPSPSYSSEVGSLDHTKFFVFLQRRGPIRSIDLTVLQIEELRRCVLDSSAEVCTIYVLRNRGGYFLKGIAPSFDDIRSTLLPIYGFCAEHNFRPITFPVPSLAESTQSDLIDAAARSQTAGEDQTISRIEILDPSARSYIGALTDLNRGRFMKFFSEEWSLIEQSPIQEELADLLDGVAREHASRIRRSLGFVLEIEDRLRTTTWYMMRQFWGAEHWRKSFESALAGGQMQFPVLADDELESPFSDWSFSELERAWGILASRFGDLGTQFRALLGERFKSDLSEARELRNELAHGRFQAKVDANGVEVGRFLSAAKVRMKLDRFVQGQLNEESPI